MSGVGQPQPSSGGSTLIAQCWQVWARSDSHRVSGPQLTPLARSGQGGLQTTVNIAECLHGAQASHITEPGERNLLRSDEKVLVAPLLAAWHCLCSAVFVLYLSTLGLTFSAVVWLCLESYI